MLAYEAGADFVKVFPCAEVGGHHYIRALKAPLPHVPLIAAGGVTQSSAPHYITAGAVAIGVGEDLIPRQAVPPPRGRLDSRTRRPIPQLCAPGPRRDEITAIAGCARFRCPRSARGHRPTSLPAPHSTHSGLRRHKTSLPLSLPADFPDREHILHTISVNIDKCFLSFR